MSSFSTGSPPLSSLGSNEPIYNNNNYNSNDSNDKNSNGIIKDKSSSEGSNAGRRVIQWDEAVIEEHNKLRGTRQRIEVEYMLICYTLFVIIFITSLSNKLSTNSNLSYNIPCISIAL